MNSIFEEDRYKLEQFCLGLSLLPYMSVFQFQNLLFGERWQG